MADETGTPVAKPAYIFYVGPDFKGVTTEYYYPTTQNDTNPYNKNYQSKAYSTFELDKTALRLGKPLSTAESHIKSNYMVDYSSGVPTIKYTASPMNSKEKDALYTAVAQKEGTHALDLGVPQSYVDKAITSKAVNEVGSPEWWQNQITERETAAKNNTFENPVQKSGAYYDAFIKPPERPAQPVYSPQPVVQGTPTVFSSTNIPKTYATALEPFQMKEAGVDKSNGLFITPLGTKIPTDFGANNGLPPLTPTYSKSERWITGLPVFGPVIGMIPFVEQAQEMFLPTSKLNKDSFMGRIANDAAVTYKTDYSYGTPTEELIPSYNSGEAAWTRSFVDNKGKKTDTWTFESGKPVITTKKTAEGIETTTSRMFETVTLPKTQTVTPINAKTSIFGDTVFNQFERGLVESTYGRVLPQHITLNPLTTTVRNKELVPTDLPSIFLDVPYTFVRNKPFEAAGLYTSGRFIGGGIGYSKELTATAAKSTLPIIGTTGRALSTPVAADMFSVANAGVGAYVVGSSMWNISQQPTNEKKTEVAAMTLTTLGILGKGIIDSPAKEPLNPYAGRNMRGDLVPGPLENIWTDAKVMYQAKRIGGERGAAYNEVNTIMKAGRYQDPQVMREPVFSETTKSGKYANEIREVFKEQEHVGMGSSTMRQQYSTAIVEKTRLKVPSDVDALFYLPDQAITSLMKRGKLSKADAEGFLDVHPIPENYPAMKASAERMVEADETSFSYKLFGDPFGKAAFPRGSSEVIMSKGRTKGYGGELTYEASQVQFGRNSAATAAVIESPILKGYRGGKDIYKFLTEYQAQKAVGLERGVPQSRYTASDKAWDSFMGREFTVGTRKVKKGEVLSEVPTKTIKVRDIYEAGQKKYAAKEVEFPKYVPEKGYTSTVKSVVKSPAVIGASLVYDTKSSAKSTTGSSMFSQSSYKSSSPSTKSAGSSLLKSLSPSVIKSTSILSLKSSPASYASKSPSSSVKPSASATKSPSSMFIRSPSPSTGRSPSSSVKPSASTTRSPSSMFIRSPSSSVTKSPSPSSSVNPYSITSPSSSTSRSPSSVVITPPSIFGNNDGGSGSSGHRRFIGNRFTEIYKVGEGTDMFSSKSTKVKKYKKGILS